MDEIENLYMDKNIANAIYNKAIKEGWKNVRMTRCHNDPSIWSVNAECPITEKFYLFDKYGSPD